MPLWSLKDIKVFRQSDYLVVMDKDMRDILEQSTQHGKNQMISLHYRGVQFVSMPSGDIYVNFKDIQDKPELLK